MPRFPLDNTFGADLDLGLSARARYALALRDEMQVQQAPGDGRRVRVGPCAMRTSGLQVASPFLAFWAELIFVSWCILVLVLVLVRVLQSLPSYFASVPCATLLQIFSLSLCKVTHPQLWDKTSKVRQPSQPSSTGLRRLVGLRHS